MSFRTAAGNLICLSCLFGFFTLSCATMALSSKGQGVRLIKADPSKECVELGAVKGDYVYFGSADENQSKVVLRNKAAELGANIVRMETISPVGFISGTAFKCPE